MERQREGERKRERERVRKKERESSYVTLHGAVLLFETQSTLWITNRPYNLFLQVKKVKQMNMN